MRIIRVLQLQQLRPSHAPQGPDLKEDVGSLRMDGIRDLNRVCQIGRSGKLRVLRLTFFQAVICSSL